MPPQTRLPFFLLFLSMLFTLGYSKITGVSAAEEPKFSLPIAAPWPAGVTLHGGGNNGFNGEGYGYGPGPTHKNADENAVDFNGNADDGETKDADLLVLAIADGCVKKVGLADGVYRKNSQGVDEWYGNYGWYVVIDHPGGFQSRYAHLKSKPLVTAVPATITPKSTAPPGDHYQDCESFVAQGQPIGQIGGSGTGPNGTEAIHLHFAMYTCQKTEAAANCIVTPYKPEPMESVSLENSTSKKIQVKSENYSVGYEEIKDNALTNPDAPVFHKTIWDKYRALGGQNSFFGRAISPVIKLDRSDTYYQQFGINESKTNFKTIIIQTSASALMLPEPIWRTYLNHSSELGLPVSTYLTVVKGGKEGWRTDFQNASLFLPKDSSGIIITWDKNNAPWKAGFCAGMNTFSCTTAWRLDPYLDFSFTDANLPGPVISNNGFSAEWKASFMSDLISKVSLEYEIQGHALFKVDDKLQGDWISSEDKVTKGVTKPTWHIGKNTFTIRFWQAPGKPARIKISVYDDGLIIKKVYAFESDGTLESWAFEPEPMNIISFEPPAYPGSENDNPNITQTPGPSITPTQPFIELPPSDPPDLGNWWDEFWSAWQTRLEAWWRNLWQAWQAQLEQWLKENSEELQKRLAEALLNWLNQLLISLQGQCLGPVGLVLVTCIGAGTRTRRTRR